MLLSVVKLTVLCCIIVVCMQLGSDHYSNLAI